MVEEVQYIFIQNKVIRYNVLETNPYIHNIQNIADPII